MAGSLESHLFFVSLKFPEPSLMKLWGQQDLQASLIPLPLQVFSIEYSGWTFLNSSNIFFFWDVSGHWSTFGCFFLAGIDVFELQAQDSCCTPVCGDGHPSQKPPEASGHCFTLSAILQIIILSFKILCLSPWVFQIYPPWPLLLWFNILLHQFCSLISPRD